MALFYSLLLALISKHFMQGGNGVVVTEGEKASKKTGRLESHCPSKWWGDGGIDGIRQAASGATRVDMDPTSQPLLH